MDVSNQLKHFWLEYNLLLTFYLSTFIFPWKQLIHVRFKQKAYNRMQEKEVIYMKATSNEET